MTVPVPAGAGGVDPACEAEAVEAVARKHFGGAVWDEAPWAVQQRCRREAVGVVAAAYPVIAAAVRAEERERIAQAIEDLMNLRSDPLSMKIGTALLAAARVAREVPE